MASIKSPSETWGTLPYFKVRTWNSINQRTVNGSAPQARHASYLRKGTQLCMSKDEYYSWCDTQKEIILQLYTAGATPSIDRINSDGHYSLSNIQIVSMDTNRRKQSHLPETRKSRVSSRLIPVVLILPDGTEQNFPSLYHAAQAYGLQQPNLHKVITGLRPHHKGFSARYAREA